MSGFTRRYTFDPGQAELTKIEGVIVIDRTPAGAIQGQDSGVVLMVAELEDGEFNKPYEVVGGQDFERTFGSFGFTYDGIPHQNPCARSRLADGAIAREYWNGNGFIAAVNKRWGRLVVTRVDTTTGEVQFTRNAAVLGAQAFSYGLVSGQTITFLLDNADGAESPARITSAAGTYPTGFAGGESMTVDPDGGGATPIAFTSGDQSIEQVITRINTVLGYTAASLGTAANTIVLRSPTTGPTSSVEITAVSGAAVTTAIGFSVTGAVNGTDNSDTATFTGAVAAKASATGTYASTFTGGESMNVTIDEGTDKQIGPVDIVFQAADQTQAQVISRINTVLGYTAAVDSGSDVTTLSGRIGGTSGSVKINSVSGALVTTATGFSASTQAGTGNVANIAQVTFNEIKTIVEAAVTGIRIERTSSGNLRAASVAITAGAYITVEAATATALGFVVGDTNAIADGEATVIPAGTRVSDGTTTWVTAKTLTVNEGEAGPYTVRVRPATDDGTAVGASTGTVTTMVSPIDQDSFVVTNLLPIAAALTEAALDAAYVNALAATLGPNSVARDANLVFSARQSNAIRTALRQNALDASGGGLAGRVAVVRPPLGTTTRAQARSTTAQPGVGAYREQRVIYTFPGASTYVPQIATRGLAGGAGFTVDGIIDTGMDSWVASLCSQLPPEENPGQATSFMSSIVGLERGNPDVQDMREGDYTLFRKAGIAALRIADGTPIIQSGVTSVDPATFPNLRNIARRRMADHIQDSAAPRLNAFNKKLATRERRAQILGELNGYLSGLESRSNPSSQRIDSYLLDAKSGNTPESLAVGIFRIIGKVRTLSSLDFIVFDVEVGESVVTITEQAA